MMLTMTTTTKKELRRIVAFRPHEYLRDAALSRDFNIAHARMKNTSFVAGALPIERAPVRSPSTPYDKGADAYFLPMVFEDEDAIARLQHDRRDEVEGVFVDLPIAPASISMNDPPIGGEKDVRKLLQLAALKKAGLTGGGVRVAVVDTGIDQTIPVGRGWDPNDPAYVGGTAPRGHGTMCAWNVKLVAPDAEIWDYALLRAPIPNLGVWLADAIDCFSNLLSERHKAPSIPLVVTNSWCVYNSALDKPAGHPENYSANSAHPFNRLVRTLVAAGVDVVFCAGNCGDPHPSSACSSGDCGPGRSILGANSHPDVITVGGVTVNGDRCGYSAQGPGKLSSAKPDIVAPTHFVGSGACGPVDSGTSTATPLVAGVVACLRTRARHTPDQLKTALLNSARDLSVAGFDHDTGHGLVRTKATASALGL